MYMTEWLISANPAYYQHETAFRENGYIDWNQTRNFQIGDIVYIYCSNPLSRIKYKTIVEKINLQSPEKNYWIKEMAYDSHRYMRLSLVCEMDSDDLSLKCLHNHGLKYAPQSPCHVKEPLASYLHLRFGVESK